MADGAFTLRLPPNERVALEHLSKIEGRPMNQLATEAIKSYLQRCGPTERILGERLSRLHAYRERDPEYRNSIRAIVDAETSCEDPLEGTVVEGDFVDGEFRPSGPAQSRIRELLSA